MASEIKNELTTYNTPIFPFNVDDSAKMTFGNFANDKLVIKRVELEL